MNQAGGNREAVAEHVLGMMLCLSKRIVEVDRAMRRASGVKRDAFMGSDIHGKTVGIVGLGHVGSRVAALCRGLFAMRVLAADPYLSATEIAARGAEKVDLETLLASADFRFHQLPAHRRDPRHDRRQAVFPDAAPRLFHHHRPGRHP